jgi:hypothetical protein
VRTTAAALFGVGWVAAFALRRNRKRALLCFLGTFGALLIWWLAIPASNDRDWMPEYSRTPYARVAGNLVTVYNIRNFDYRSETDFDVRYYDRTYNLNEIESVDLVGSSWAIGDVIHTLFSFGFRNGDHVVLSVETRRERGEPQTAVRSLFAQYELAFVLADECDVLRLRSNFRKEDLYIFPTVTNAEDARTLFLAVIDRVNDLNETPEFYNLVTRNCTTSLIPLLQSIDPTLQSYDWRFLLNLYSVRMAYEDGWIDSPFAIDRTADLCHVNQYVKDNAECQGYSRRIRPALKSIYESEQ